MDFLIKTRLFSIDITLGNYNSFVEAIISKAQDNCSAYVCVANVHMLVEAQRDDQFAAIVNNADIITPDGKPLTWALKLLKGISQERVAGMDLLPDLLSAASKKGIPIGFYGGTDEMLTATKEFIYKKYPGIIIASLISPPFRPLNTDEVNMHLNDLKHSGAKLIFAVLGCPKQEKWMASIYHHINAVFVGIGGALPVLIGLNKRAPNWMQSAGLEWLYRLGQEPRRLIKRYGTTNSIFIGLVFKEKIRLLIRKISNSS